MVSKVAAVGLLMAFFVLAQSAHLPGQVSHDWTYEDEHSWAENYPECSLTKQSPIDISSHFVVQNESLRIDFEGYNHLISDFDVINTGHAIQFTYIGNEAATPKITGPALDGETLSLAQLHFHWGQTDGVGSEHTINGQSYDLELHLVHFNKEKYPTFEEALQSHHGVAVLGVFYHIDDENIDEFDNIVEMVKEVADRGGNEPVHLKHSFIMNNLLPDLSGNVNFYRYIGSLTTPPCTEGVTWLVAEAAAHIGREQIEAFRSVKDIQHNTIEGNNYRQVQKLHDRKIELFTEKIFA